MTDRPPYSLFQNDAGLWGVKDADGNIQFEAQYLRRTTSLGKEIFVHPSMLEILNFTEEDGFGVIAWCSEPWWEEALEVTTYPEEFIALIEPLLFSGGITPHDMDQQLLFFNGIPSLEPIISELRFCFIYENLKDDEDDEALEEEWFDEHPSTLSAQERVDATMPFITNTSYPFESRTSLAWLTFMFNYNFKHRLK